MGKLPIRARVATTIGGAAGRMSRLTGRGDGSVIGGVVGLRVAPDLLRQLAAGRQIVLVTGTNGKTTTTRLVTAAIGALGQEVATNAFGANMESGLVSALSSSAEAPYAVLEVDERHLPTLITSTNPRAIVLLNLSRDQMDRASEIWLIARRWREAFGANPQCRVVANADDPLVAWAAGSAGDVTWVAAGQRWHEDSWCCPDCGSHLRRDELGWRCGECSLSRPSARWVLDGDNVIDAAGTVRELRLALPGRANRSNAVMALAVASLFGADVDQALPELRKVTSVAGRYTSVQRRGRTLRLLLAKNPAGWLEAFDVVGATGTLDGSDSAADGTAVAGPGGGADGGAGGAADGRGGGAAGGGAVPILLAVNAQGPDGRDTSWLWDVDYRVLSGRRVLVTGERKVDLAVRLEADEIPFDLVDDIDAAVEAVPQGPLDVIANYTAFQQIRATVGRSA